MQEILLYIFCLIFGYLAGVGFRYIVGKVVSGGKHCNIHKSGRKSRFILGLILIAGGVYFGWPLLVFFGGFTLYEAHKKWCVFHVEHENV